jgi:lipopolysaccharide export system protein LptC
MQNQQQHRPAVYDTAVRHSRRVWRLKILLPLLAIVVTVGFLGISYLRTAVPGNVELVSARIEDGKIVMEAPAISGTNADGARYSMKAAEALQDIKNPSMITLQKIQAEVPVNKQISAKVEGDSGIFDRDTDRLEMTAPFSIKLSNGMNAQFQSAHLDVPAGQMLTTDPVTINTDKTTISASTLRMTDKGQVIIFEGGVKVSIAADTIRKKGS